ncbi:hypothetical protein LTR15_006007 [Elasticomyces elasticus]|nr:hypothetical protein LTR15_006007 [Elasticomyces elasticus]
MVPRLESKPRFTWIDPDKPQHPDFLTIENDSAVDECLRVSGIIVDGIAELGTFQPKAIVFTEQVYLDWLSLLEDSGCHSHATCNGCENLVWGPQMVCEQCENLSLCIPCFSEHFPGHPGEHGWNIDEGTHGKTHEERSVDPRYSVWECLADIKYPFVEDDESVQDAFRKTVMLDQSTGEMFDLGPRMRSLFDIAVFTEFWLTHIERRDEVLMMERRDYTIEETGAMLSAIKPEYVQELREVTTSSIYRKRLFVTAKGYIGLAPHDAKKGDLVGAVYGSHMPYILRKLGAGSASDTADVDCTLVGDAYVHDLMKGEADKLAEYIPELATRFVIH